MNVYFFHPIEFRKMLIYICVMEFHIHLNICPFGSNIPQLTYLHIYTQSMFVDLFTFRLQEAMSGIPLAMNIPSF